ncbi:MAG: alkaline phosphatase family protein [Thiolinea sp.]
MSQSKHAVKVILVIIDGAGYNACRKECGYLEGLVELGQAECWKMQTALPSISAPLYETIHTGLSPIQHGITCNEGMRASAFPNVFSAAVAAGLRTAAVGHSYFFSLYSGYQYDMLRHIEFSDDHSPIQRGRFYSMEAYSKMNICAPAEIDLCAQTLLLAEQHNPDYLLLHTSSVDSIGHAYGGTSREYHRQIYQVDTALSRTIPLWRDLGYEIMITADHGINEEAHHGGTEAIVREVPFYYIGSASRPAADTLLDQRAIAPTILGRMGVPIPDTMTLPAFLGN